MNLTTAPHTDPAPLVGEQLERRLEELLQQNRFAPPARFLQGELEGTTEMEAQIREHVAAHIGKLARPKRILWSDDLPKTRSGKIMRRLLRGIAEGRALGDVTTLRDPTVMAALEQQIAAEQARED